MNFHALRRTTDVHAGRAVVDHCKRGLFIRMKHAARRKGLRAAAYSLEGLLCGVGARRGAASCVGMMQCCTLQQLLVATICHNWQHGYEAKGLAGKQDELPAMMGDEMEGASSKGPTV